MTSLAETIDTALAAVGPETEDRLRDVVSDFEGQALADEERLAALATSIAAIAAGDSSAARTRIHAHINGYYRDAAPDPLDDPATRTPTAHETR